MKAVVVYESHWGNTAAIAKAVAEGIGPDAKALSTAEAVGAAVAAADLIVAGAPVIAFNLPMDFMLKGMAQDQTKYKRPPDLSRPSMRAWLGALPSGNGRFAAFETGIGWSPGGAKGGIESGLERAGYRRLAKGRRFLVGGYEGPLRDGELEKAKAWGVELAQSMK